MATTEWGRISFENPNGTITTVIIQAAKYIDSEGEGVTFSLRVEGNNPSISAGDIQGFFIDFEDIKEPSLGSLSGLGVLNLSQGDDTILWAGTKANNMNGTAANAAEGAIANDGYDVGVELTTPGTSGGNVDFVTFSIKGINLDALDGQRFGIRLQNTLNEEGSLKLEGIFDQPNIVTFQGLSHGYWKNHGPDSIFKPGEGLFNDWNNESKDPVTGTSKPVYDADNSAVSFEQFFDVDIDWTIPGTGGFDDITLQDALGLTGGGLNALAREATAALLNSRDENIEIYKYSESDIASWTQQVFTGIIPDTDGNGIGDWASNTEAITGLKDLFEMQNTLNLQTIV